MKISEIVTTLLLKSMKNMNKLVKNNTKFIKRAQGIRKSRFACALQKCPCLSNYRYYWNQAMSKH